MHVKWQLIIAQHLSSLSCKTFSFPADNNRFRNDVNRTKFSASVSQGCKALVSFIVRVLGESTKGIVIPFHASHTLRDTNHGVCLLVAFHASHTSFCSHHGVRMCTRPLRIYFWASVILSLLSTELQRMCLDRWCCWGILLIQSFWTVRVQFERFEIVNGLFLRRKLRAATVQTGKIVYRKILFRKKRRHNRLTISFSLMKCQVTWL